MDIIPPAEPPSFLQRNTGEIVAIAAFVLSLTVSVISAWYAIRGSEVVLLAPDRVIIYRDEINGDAAARVAVPMSLINTASADHGDVVVQVDGSFPADTKGGLASFEFGSTVQPVFTEFADKAAQGCEIGARCIALPRLLIVDRDARLIDVPGGAARSQYVAFTLSQWNCTGAKAICDRFSSFEQVAEQISGRELDITLTIQLYSDGKKQARCKTRRAIDREYLVQTGWLSLTCQSLKVS